MTSMSLDRPRLPAWALVSLVATLVLAATLGGLPGSSLATASAQGGDEPAVLFFHKTTGFRHDSIEDAIQAVEELGAEHGFSVTATQDAAVFEDASLREYAANFGTGGSTNMSLTIHGGTGAPRYAIRNIPQTGVQDVNAPASALRRPAVPRPHPRSDPVGGGSRRGTRHA